MKVLVACEESQEVCKAFRALGHEAYSCDIQEPSGGHTEWHILGDALKAQYWHAAKRAQLFREIPPSYVLPLTWRPDFLFKERGGKKGASPLMDVMWCVWLTPQMQGVQTVFKPLMRPEKVT